MKVLFIAVVLLCSNISFCQDSLRLRHIDSLVSVIDYSSLAVKHDTLNADQPAHGIFMNIYVSAWASDTELKKYERRTSGSNTNSGKTETMHSSMIFYFHGNKLIKAEELLDQGTQKGHVIYYYWDGIPLRQILSKVEGAKPGIEDRLPERAKFLLTVAASITIKLK